jgi:drug/metabolite transporter (DMT)-like permease
VPHSLTGHAAALGAACCWAFSALAFEQAGRRMGALTLNLVRLVIALAFLCLASGIARGIPLPVDASAHAWAWLSVSGLVGFVFGDLCLFRAFLVIGPRLSVLVMSLVPPITAVLGWLVLGETLGGRDLLGMTLTVTGIAWALLERGRVRGEEIPSRISPSGVALAFGGALGQAGGLVLSKLGMGSYPAFAATQVRVIAGIAGYVLLFFALRWWPRVGEAVRDTGAVGYASLGAFFGPFLGVTLSLIAVRATVAGVAASIMALTPIVIIPLVVLLRRERVGVGGIAGAVVAVAGVVLLFL